MKQHRNETIGFSALLIGSGTFLSRILGFVRDALLTAFFTRTVTDAWLVAFRLPNLFRRLLGEGALSVSFIPVLTDRLKDSEPHSRKHLIDGMFTLLLAVLIAITFLGIIFAEPIVHLLTKGEAYSSIPGKVELTVRLARIMFVYVLLVSLYAYFMAILNTLKEFWWPAFAPVLWNISMITAAVLPLGAISESGEVLAWGVVLGGVLQVAILIPRLMARGYLPCLSFHFNTPEIRQVFRGLGPSMIGLGIMQITILVNTGFASYLPEGSNTWIFMADRILELPLSLFAVSLGTALLPTLASHWSDKREFEFHNTSQHYLRLLLFLSIPAAAGCFVLADPIIRVLFERGQFGNDDVVQTAGVLKIYSIAIVMYACVRVLAPSFYAIKNTWYPALCSLMGLVVHIFLAKHLIQIYQLQGLVMSTVMSSTVNMLLLFIGYKFLIGPFQYKRLFRAVVKFVPATAALVILIQQYDLVKEFLETSVGTHFLLIPKLSQVIGLALMVACGAAIYLGTSALFKVEELKPISSRIMKRFKK